MLGTMIRPKQPIHAHPLADGNALHQTTGVAEPGASVETLARLIAAPHKLWDRQPHFTL